MYGVNSVTLLGNLGADPELRFTQGGSGVLNLRLATTTQYKDKDGEYKDNTQWHNVTIWGKRAEALSKIVEKGSPIFVRGELRTSSYKDKEGVERYKTEVNAHEVILVGGKSDKGDDGGRDERSRGRDDRRSDDRRPRDDRRDARRDDLRPANDDVPDWMK
jgi:single-strand DNA-binding protein